MRSSWSCSPTAVRRFYALPFDFDRFMSNRFDGNRFLQCCRGSRSGGSCLAGRTGPRDRAELGRRDRRPSRTAPNPDTINVVVASVVGNIIVVVFHISVVPFFRADRIAGGLAGSVFCGIPGSGCRSGSLAVFGIRRGSPRGCCTVCGEKCAGSQCDGCNDLNFHGFSPFWEFTKIFSVYFIFLVPTRFVCY